MPLRRPEGLRDPNRFRPDHEPLLAGAYECTRCLGEGGFGTVYEARRRADGQTVAVKVLHAHDADGALRRFEREYHALRQIDHPGILRVGASALGPDAAYFEMEFLPGGSLRARMNAQPWLEASPAVRVRESERLAGALLDAMVRYHDEGLVHRDLKPENILFRGRDPVLADFGAVAFSDAIEHAADESITTEGLVVGTIRYMAPEQLVCEPVDIRADVYALATILYELITHAHPYDDTDQRQVALKYRKLTLPASLDRLHVVAPEPIVGVIGRALSLEPDERFDDPRAFQKALRDAHRPLRASARRGEAADSPRSDSLDPDADASDDAEGSEAPTGLAQGEARVAPPPSAHPSAPGPHVAQLALLVGILVALLAAAFSLEGMRRELSSIREAIERGR